jgi:tetratricopeptide (TPR) repeat protein
VFLWGVVQLVRQTRRAFRARLDPSIRGVLVGLTAGLVAMLVHAAVDSTLHEPALVILLAVYAALILTIGRCANGAEDATVTIPVGSRPVFTAAAVLGIAGVTLLVLRFGLGWIAYEAGVTASEPRVAVSRLHTAIDLDPGKSLYHSALAAAYFREFQSTKAAVAAQSAIDELTRAMDLNPMDGRLPGLLGHLYLILGSSNAPAPRTAEDRTTLLRAGITAYQRAIELEPFMPSHRLALGQLFMAVGEPDTAEAHVQHAVEIEPNFLPAREWLARRYLKSGRRDAAKQQYQEILRRQHDYADRPKDPLEERYLTVDAAALAAELDAVRRTS